MKPILIAGFPTSEMAQHFHFSMRNRKLDHSLIVFAHPAIERPEFELKGANITSEQRINAKKYKRI